MPINQATGCEPASHLSSRAGPGGAQGRAWGGCAGLGLGAAQGPASAGGRGPTAHVAVLSPELCAGDCDSTRPFKPLSVRREWNSCVSVCERICVCNCECDTVWMCVYL